MASKKTNVRTIKKKKKKRKAKEKDRYLTSHPGIKFPLNYDTVPN